MEVIGAGIGRTGTNSLKLALERLLGGRCYHMEVVVKEREHCHFWYQWARDPSSVPDLRAELQGFVAGVDAPLCFFYRELMALHPNAKVILTTRDPTSWVTSFQSLMRTTKRLAWLRLVSSHVRRLTQFSDAMEARFLPSDRSDASLVRWFERHNAEVRATVPPDRLLELPVGAGWAPLCAFLGVPVPSVPYPRSNAGMGQIREAAMRAAFRRG